MLIGYLYLRRDSYLYRIRNEVSDWRYERNKKKFEVYVNVRDEQLMPLIEEIHAESAGTYGARRITRALRRKGVDVARCTVERLMAELDIEGVIRGRRRRTTISEPSAVERIISREGTAAR